jgi:hypothetical protein
MDDAARPARFLRILIAVLVVVALAGIVIGMNRVGERMQASLRDEPRYALDFSAIVCDPAPPMACESFLSEVQYLADRPDELSILEPELAAKLAAAFAQHPWVEAVEHVEVRPPHSVVVRLRYRRPVLAVATGREIRAVDRSGVLLPTSAKTDGLQRYPGKASPPAGPAGRAWGDPDLEAAARGSTSVGNVPH